MVSICGGSDAFAMFDDLEDAKNIRHNLDSVYMFASVCYNLFLMLVVTGFNVTYISYFMKEHQVPLIFRNPDSSIYYDTQRAKNLFYMIFIVLTGVLGSLNFYNLEAPCLHTYNEEKFSSEFVDLYQYSLTALLWIVSLPMMFLILMVGMKDNLKFGCYPIVIANIIFAFMLFVLSFILIINALIYSENFYIRLAHLIKFGVLGISLGLNIIYRAKFAKYDIAKEEESADFDISVGNTPAVTAR